MDINKLKKQVQLQLSGAHKDLQESRDKGHIEDMEYNFGYIDAMNHVLFIIDNE